MIALLIVLCAVAALGQLAGLLVLRVNFRDTPTLDDEPALADGPSVLVVVPARNEETNIAACLEALSKSIHKRLIIRVVDDGSTDRTSELAHAVAARDPRIEIIRGVELPPGWMGKNHALWVGTRGATADYLLFVDADVRVGPECISRAVAAAERHRADLVTVMPRLLALGFWELAAQTQIAQLILGWLPARQINDPGHPRAQGIGPFMFFRRSAYEAIGGHESVRGEVVEDMRIAERLKHAGLRLLYMRGVNHVEVRMYDSLASLVRGYTKNFHEPMKNALWLAPILAAFHLVIFAGPYLLLPLALATHSPTAIVLSAAALAFSLLSRLDAHLRWRLTPRHPYLAPLGALIVAHILLSAALHTALHRPVLWKGRQVS